jgi:hypothetical protein
MRAESEISEHELKLMELRSDAATAGPWFSLIVGRDLEAGSNCIELGGCAAMEVIGGTDADQDFIANARNDLPRLIVEVRRLRAQMNLQASLLTATEHRAQAFGSAQHTDAEMA